MDGLAEAHDAVQQAEKEVYDAQDEVRAAERALTKAKEHLRWLRKVTGLSGGET
jgi:hypothetical protein